MKRMVCAVGIWLAVCSGMRAGPSPVAAVLEPYVASNWLAGAVTVVVAPDGVVAHDAVGYADVAAKQPMTQDALFWIASMTKPFTAVAELTKIQTGNPKQKYGLGFTVDQDGHGAFGHGGAAGTNMVVFPEARLALIWLVQVSGGYPGKGGQAQGAFKEAGFKVRAGQ